MMRLAMAAAMFGIIIFGFFNTLNAKLQAQGELPSTGNVVVDTGCRITGCSDELCVSSNQPRPVVSNCIYRQEYGCYKTAHCQLLDTGSCAWEPTMELSSCIQRNRSAAPVQ